MLSKPYEVFTPKKMQKMVYAASKLSMESLSHQTYRVRFNSAWGGLKFSASVSARILKTSIK
jgi:hypothetical protein